MNYNTYELTFTEEKLLRNHMTKIFALMSLALLISATTSYLGYNIIINIPDVADKFSLILIGAAFVQLILIFSMGAIITKSKSILVGILMFLLYSVLTGITFSSIGLIYSVDAIIHAFATCTLFFAALCIVGHMTGYKMLKYGRMLIFALIFLIITEVLSSILSLGTSNNIIFDFVAIVIFGFYTVHDFQRIKFNYVNAQNDREKNIAIVFGALSLYIDFVAIFVRILSIFSNESD